MMPNDVESELRQVFEETAAGVPVQIAERLRGRDYRPRTHGRTVLPGIAASVLLIGGASAIVAVDDGTGSAPATSGAATVAVAPPKPVVTTAVVVKRLPVVTLSRLQLAAQALQDVSGDIFHVTTTGVGGYVSEDLITADGNTQLVTVHDPSGTLSENMLVKNTGPAQNTTDVDYLKHTWWTLSGLVPTPPPNCEQPTCFDAANGGIMPGKNLGGAPLSTEGVQWLISHGAKVSDTTPAPAGNYALLYSPGGSIVETLFVDTTTNLPTKVSYTDGGKAIFASAVEWLSPTDANLAKLTLAVPDGYTKVPPTASY